jgi:hypothetical protein
MSAPSRRDDIRERLEAHHASFELSDELNQRVGRLTVGCVHKGYCNFIRWRDTINSKGREPPTGNVE